MDYVSRFVCACVHNISCASRFTYMPAGSRICMYVFMYVYIQVCMHLCTYACRYMLIHHASMYSCSDTCMQVCMCAYVKRKSKENWNMPA